MKYIPELKQKQKPRKSDSSRTVLQEILKDEISERKGFIIEIGVLVGYDGEGGDVVIPNSVESIGAEAFADRETLTSITLGNSVTSIYNFAFVGCSSLTSITLSDSVKSIGACAFDGCYELTIKGYAGSYAETYAKENGIPFEEIKEK